MNIGKRMQSLVVARFREWRDTEYLIEQPDHILRDIGLCRGDIATSLRFGRQDAALHRGR